MAGTITTDVADNITLWMNECVYQLAMKTGATVNTILPEQRNYITLDRVAMVIKFDHGPSVILGGIDIWNGSPGSPQTVGGTHGWEGLQSLATQVLAADLVIKNTETDILKKYGEDAIGPTTKPDVGSFIKYVENVVAPLGLLNSSEFRHITDGGLDQCTFWADTTSDVGEGWGITFGTETASGTKSNTYDHSLFINSPSPQTFPNSDTYPVDTQLYKLTATDGANNFTYSSQTSSLVPVQLGNTTPGGWGEAPDITVSSGDPNIESVYNHGELAHIELWATIKSTVLTENSGGLSDIWKGNTWYKMIGHELISTDLVAYNLSAEDPGVDKVGWVGALDKEEAQTAIDVNDGIQDVRIRFAHGRDVATNSVAGMSSKAWNPKDVLNWSVHRTAAADTFGSFTNEYLLPSRVSILSSYGQFANSKYYYEVTSAVAPDQWEWINSFGSTTVVTIDSGVDRLRNYGGHDVNTDTFFLDLIRGCDYGQGAAINTFYITPASNNLVIETGGIPFNRKQSGSNGEALVEDSDIIAATATSVVDIITHTDYTKYRVWDGNSWEQNTVDLVYQNQTVEEFLTGLATNGDDFIKYILEDCLTLALFDPGLWWSNSNYAGVPIDNQTYLEIDEETENSDGLYERRRDHGQWSGTDAQSTFVYSDPENADPVDWDNRMEGSIFAVGSYVYYQFPDTAGYVYYVVHDAYTQTGPYSDIPPPGTHFTEVENQKTQSWWDLNEDSLHWKKYSHGRKFQRNTDARYFNVKLLAFQPNVEFSKNDKLRITVPLGNSTAQS